MQGNFVKQSIVLFTLILLQLTANFINIFYFKVCRTKQNTALDPSVCFSNLCNPDEDCVCSEAYFQCMTGGCVPVSKVCDYHPDCDDNSDEMVKCSYPFCFICVVEYSLQFPQQLTIILQKLKYCPTIVLIRLLGQILQFQCIYKL